MKKMWIMWLVAFAMVLTACQGSTDESKTIIVKDAWARSALQGNTSAIYFLIDNSSEVDDALLSASTDVAMMTELHMSSVDASGIMKMSPQENVPVPAKSSVEFKQGGLHVMLMGLMKDLKPGDLIKLTLNFENAGKISLEVPVKEP